MLYQAVSSNNNIIEFINTSYQPLLQEIEENRQGLLAIFNKKTIQATADNNLYLSLASKLIEEVNSMLSYRQETVIPYLHTLSRKVAEGHNCSACSGKCNLPHQTIIQTLMDDVNKTREHLYRMYKVAKPNLFELQADQIDYKTVRIIMHSMELNVLQLLFFDEYELINFTKDGQVQIYAYA
jgi:hypothetical protein